MNRAQYVLPEFVLILGTEIFFLLATGVLVFSYLHGKLWDNIRCCCECCHKEIDKYIHHMLQSLKILEPGKENDFEDPKSQLHDFKFLRGHVYCLTLCLLWMVCAAGVVFWDVLLIEVTNSCDPSASRAHCFLNTGFFNFSGLSDEPIDCQKLGNLPKNTTFICYKYALNIGGAFGTAGGMLSTGLILFKVFAANTAFVKKRNATCSYALWICHLVICTMFIFTTLLAVTFVPILREIVLEGSVTVMCQYFNILILMAATFVVVIVTLCKRKQKGSEIEMQIKGTEL